MLDIYIVIDGFPYFLKMNNSIILNENYKNCFYTNNAECNLLKRILNIPLNESIRLKDRLFRNSCKLMGQTGWCCIVMQIMFGHDR